MIPAGGLYGAALVEARKAASGASALPSLLERIEAAARAALSVINPDTYVYIVGLWSDHVIVSQPGTVRKLWSFDWSEDTAGKVTLSDKTEVIETHMPVAAKVAEAAGGVLALAEAAEGGGSLRYKVRVIRAGLSGNNNFYPDAVLREALPLFKGARVFVVSDVEHIKGGGKDVRNLIGKIDAAVFVEGVAADTGEIQAVLTLIDAADPLSSKIREAVAGGMADLFGLSINADGVVREKSAGRVKIREAVKLTKVKSVDLIVEPGAGGAVLSLIEALDDAPQNPKTQKEAEAMLREALIEKIKAARPDLLAGKDVSKIDDAGLTALLTEALAPPPAPPPNAATAEEVARLVESRLVQRQVGLAKMREAIAGSKLPAAAKARLTTEFEGMPEFSEAQVESRLKDEAAYLVSLGAGGGRVTGLGDRPLIESMEDRNVKVQEMLEAFFDPKHKDHRRTQSFKECYVEITGDRRVTGLLRDCDASRLSEAVGSGDFPTLLGNVINKRMLEVYAAAGLDYWRLLTGDPVPATNFKDRTAVRIGDYGRLPKVREKQAYEELTSPGEDTPAVYAIEKFGGVETVSWEAIKNDDVGLIRRLPGKIGDAAKLSLCLFVMEFLELNPAIYDGKALFHVDHGNLGTAALAADSYTAAALAVKTQTKFGQSGRKIGRKTKYLWVPDGLEETATDLFKRDTNLDETFAQSLKPTIIPVEFWDDQTDWAISCDPSQAPFMELAFLEGNEEPEMFAQDSPTAGSLFTNDVITYKVRHVYGGAVVDYRPVRKHVVA